MLRLHRLGKSDRHIARVLGMGRDTIREHLAALDRAGLREGSPDAVPDFDVLSEALARELPVKTPPQQTSSIEAWRPLVEELRGQGCTPTVIFDRIRLRHPDFPGSLSAVKRMCLRLKRTDGPRAVDVALRVETRPGEIAQVDFGYAGKRFDPDTGVVRRCWVFVMVLSYSRHVFCDLVFDQKVASWIDLHIRAFEFFGGVPETIVPDNLKAAVIRGAFGAGDEVVLNRSYRELARHYSFAIDPTPIRAPQKKGKVESGVKYVKQSFLAGRDGADVEEDRRQLLRWVLEIAGRRRHGTTGRRPLEVFEGEEKATLRPLPKERYEIVLWKKVKLHTDSHVQIDGAFYSAPWRYLHQDLWAKTTRTTILLLFEDRRIATHRRVGRGERSTNPQHLPEHRAHLCHRSRTYWEERAEAMGEDVLSLVRDVFQSDEVLSQLRVVQAIVTHLESFPVERARAASRRARHFGCHTYGGLKNILRQGLDLVPFEAAGARAWSANSRFARRPRHAPSP
ncbi:MAG: IS21 family transposase [Planctomycetota bacterium JB042]